jgi:hypothetical protein
MKCRSARAGISQWVRSAAASLPISTGQLRLLRPQAAGFRLDPEICNVYFEFAALPAMVGSLPG